MPVSLDWMIKHLNIELIITNSYILKNSKYKDEILKKGLHKFFGFDGVIYTDSGTFQMYSQGRANISNEETIAFQKAIGSDIITPLDLFTLPSDDKKTARLKLEKSFERSSLLEKMHESYSLPLQGGLYVDLRKKAALLANKYEPAVYAIGGIVPLMESYDFLNLVKVVYAVKSLLKPNVPVHAFGAGHPLVLPLLVLLGVDVFDSASYALYAYDRRMICPHRTYNVDELEYFPCSCRYCEAEIPKDLTTEELAKHNLTVIFEELESIKEAIHEGTLYEYVEYKLGARPELVKAYRWIMRSANKWLQSYEPMSRKRGFLTRDESFKRPLVKHTKNRLSYVKSSCQEVESFMGKIPLSLALSYPFSQVSTYKHEYSWYAESIYFMNKEPLSFIKDVLAYQFRDDFSYKVKWENVKFIYSKTTKRLREVRYKNKVMLTLRSYDNLFVPRDEFYYFLKSQNINFPYKVKVFKEAEPFVKSGRNVFAKFVKDVKGAFQPQDFIAILSEDGRDFLGWGQALLSHKEIPYFKRGVAVKRK